MTHELKLIVEPVGERVHLLSPSVGLFSRALAPGAVLTPGAPAGVLETLGLSQPLVTPPSVAGRVVNDRPERVFEPVGYGALLYELAPLADGAVECAPAPDAAVDHAAGLVFRAPYSGRLWRRPSPQDPPFVEEGDTIAEGDTIGLLEVMKTFTHLHYAAEGGLPARARLVKLLVEDGGEVSAGAPILEVEERTAP